MQKIEEIINKANGMKYYSKIDFKSAFNQILLDKESRYVSRFRTHNGIYQHKRLFYGISSAPEIFHNAIKQLLIGVNGALNASDDMLIMGETYNLDQVFNVLN